MTDQLIILDDDTEKKAYLACLDYVYKRFSGVTLEAYAGEYGVTPRTVYNWQRKWREIGIYQKVEQEYLAVQNDQILRAADEALREWPLIVHQIIEKAKDPQTPIITKLSLASWLNTEVIGPARVKAEQQDQKKEETPETVYLNNLSPAQFNPTDVYAEIKSDDGM